MFTRSLSALLYALLLTVTTMANSKVVQPQSTALQSNTQAALELLNPWDSETAPGVAIAVMLDDNLVLNTGLGLANLEHTVAITAETVFEVASVSKQFTAFAIFLLVSEDKLNIDADIRKYLPELQDRGIKLSIRHLLNHTGGLREVFTLSRIAGWLEEDIRTNQQYMHLLANQTGQNFNPGEQVEYSNSGYFLLSQIVERVSKQSFADFTHQRIFAPLGMNNTQFNLDRGSIIKNKATSYSPSNDGFRQSHLVSEVAGSTGLHTTTLDLLKWADNFRTRKIGNDFVFKLMAQRSIAADNQPSIAANGQELRPYKGFQTWSHGGTMSGYRSFIMRIPEADFAVSILSNRSDFDTAKIAFELTDIFLSDNEIYIETPQLQWERATSKQLQGYVGDYELFRGMIFSITTDSDSLYFSFNGSEKNMLPQIADHQFDLNPNNNLFIEFQADGHGQSQSLNYTIGVHGSIKAKRITLEPFDSTSVDLNEFAGLFYSDELMSQFAIVVENNQLIAKHIRLPDAILKPHQKEVFVSSEGNIPYAKFIRNNSGEVIGVNVSGQLALDVEFIKIKRQP